MPNIDSQNKFFRGVSALSSNDVPDHTPGSGHSVSSLRLAPSDWVSLNEVLVMIVKGC